MISVPLVANAWLGRLVQILQGKGSKINATETAHGSVEDEPRPRDFASKIGSPLNI
jgi:hypothetical protein